MCQYFELLYRDHLVLLIGGRVPSSGMLRTFFIVGMMWQLQVRNQAAVQIGKPFPTDVANNTRIKHFHGIIPFLIQDNLYCSKVDFYTVTFPLFIIVKDLYPYLTCTVCAANSSFLISLCECHLQDLGCRLPNEM